MILHDGDVEVEEEACALLLIAAQVAVCCHVFAESAQIPAHPKVGDVGDFKIGGISVKDLPVLMDRAIMADSAARCNKKK